MHLTLHLTGRCNMRCNYCYDASHRGGDMAFSTVQSAIAFALRDEKTCESACGIGISFYGGEPLLQRQVIHRTLRHCAELSAQCNQPFHFKITTNGLLLDEAFLTDADTRQVFVALSHDGLPAAHDAHRVDAVGAGTAARLDETIDLLLHYKPYAPVMMTVTPQTVHSYGASVEYLYQRGFRYLISVLNFAGAWDAAALRELRAQYNQLAHWYEAETRKEQKFYFSPFESKIASHINPERCREARCDFGRRQLSIAPNGRIYPCVQFVGDGSDDVYCIGDVTGGIDEEKHRRLADLNAAEKAQCASCTIHERCQNGCGCQNWQATGAIDHVSPAICAHERIVLPIADRLAARLFKARNALFIQKQYNNYYPLLSLLEDALD